MSTEVPPTVQPARATEPAFTVVNPMTAPPEYVSKLPFVIRSAAFAPSDAPAIANISIVFENFMRLPFSTEK
jgi:hypothetical protein